MKKLNMKRNKIGYSMVILLPTSQPFAKSARKEFSLIVKFLVIYSLGYIFFDPTVFATYIVNVIHYFVGTHNYRMN